MNGLHQLCCHVASEQTGLWMQHTTESHCKTGSHRGGGNTHCTPHTSYQCRNAISPQSNKKSAAVTMPLDSYQLEFHGRLITFLHAQEPVLTKIDLPVVACSFHIYLKMAVVQMMYTHVTLLCPPPQQQVWALLGGGSCRGICSSPSPRRRSHWLSKIMLSVEMLYGCRSRIEHA